MWQRLGGNRNSGTTRPMRYELVKGRPSRLQDDFVAIDDRRSVDQVFLRLRRQFCQQSPNSESAFGKATVIREMGMLDPDRLYFYLKPLNRDGWLFERTGSGWLVSKAEKIVGQNTFVRSHEPWDRVTLYEAKKGTTTAPRLTSDRLGTELVSFAVYEQKLRSTIVQELI